MAWRYSLDNLKDALHGGRPSYYLAKAVFFVRLFS